MRTLSASKVRQTKVVAPVVVVGASVAAAVWVARDDWAREPILAAISVAGFGLFTLGYLWWSGYWRLADNVVELPEGLRVRRGRHEIVVTFREIARVGFRTLHSRSVCTLELHAAGVLGSRIEFLPLSGEESVSILGKDLWEYLEMAVTDAHRERAV
jgi:hypothetical protein